MFCKIIFFEDNNDWQTISEYLKREKNSFEIISVSPDLKEFLRKNGHISKTINDVFPYFSDKSIAINKKSKNQLEEYRLQFKKIKFFEYEIFNGIEHQLLSQIIFVEKMKAILEDKQNIYFIFKGFSFSYFILQKLSFELGFNKTNFTINRVDGKKIKRIPPNYSESISKIKNKINFIKSLSKKRTKNKQKNNSMFNLGEDTKIEASSSNYNIKSKTNFEKSKQNSKFFIIRIILLKLLILAHFDFSNWIMKRIIKKINLHPNHNSKYAFFISPTRPDALWAIFPIMQQFNKNNTDYIIFTFDLLANKNLLEENFSNVNLFEEAYLFSNILKNKHGKELIQQIINLAKNQNLEFIHFDGYTNPILRDIFLFLSMLLICEYIFPNLKFKTIVVTDGNRFSEPVILTSKRFGIKSYYVQSLLITPYSTRSLYKVDKLCVYGTQGIEVLKEMGHPLNQLEITGNPRYDYLKNIDHKEQRKFLESEYGICNNKKLVVVGLTLWYENDEIWMSNLIKFCNDNNIEIVIKVHPFYKIIFQDVHKQKIHEIKKSCKKQKYLITYDIEPSILLSASDLVVSDFTNLGIEAILLEKPLITVNFTKDPIEKLRSNFPYESSVYTSDYKLLEKYILEILKEKKHIDKMRQKWTESIKKFNLFNDGQAAQRIFELMTI